jgi:hypothetical protein
MTNQELRSRPFREWRDLQTVHFGPVQLHSRFFYPTIRLSKTWQKLRKPLWYRKFQMSMFDWPRGSGSGLTYGVIAYIYSFTSPIIPLFRNLYLIHRWLCPYFLSHWYSPYSWIAMQHLFPVSAVPKPRSCLSGLIPYLSFERALFQCKHKAHTWHSKIRCGFNGRARRVTSTSPSNCLRLRFHPSCWGTERGTRKIHIYKADQEANHTLILSTVLINYVLPTRLSMRML